MILPPAWSSWGIDSARENRLPDCFGQSAARERRFVQVCSDEGGKTMSLSKKFAALLLFSALFSAASAGLSAPASAAYPEKAIRLIIQSSPGGGSDLFARTFTNVVTNNRLLPVVVTPENMPGASGAVAYAYVAQRAGDPYLLLNASGTFITTPILGQGTSAGKVNYKEFTPIAALCLDELAIAVHADSPYKTLEDVIEAAKKDPGSMLAGGTEFGSPDSICFYLLEKESGCKFNYVVFDGGDEVNAALLGKNIDAAIGNPGDFMELYKGGRIRILATFSDQRLSVLPDIPTATEAGYKVIYQLTRGFAAPKGIPGEAVKVLEKCVADYMETKEWKNYVNANSLTVRYLDSGQFTEFLAKSTEMHATILKEMGVIK
jgi:putative tricarboxylic transport membrane protein